MKSISADYTSRQCHNHTTFFTFNNMTVGQGELAGWIDKQKRNKNPRWILPTWNFYF
jgi:hypothetical protein